MDMKELRGKSSDELQKVILDIRNEQFSLRMQKGTGQSSRPHIFKSLKKDIARAKTLLNEIRAGKK